MRTRMNCAGAGSNNRVREWRAPKLPRRGGSPALALNRQRDGPTRLSAQTTCSARWHERRRPRDGGAERDSKEAQASAGVSATSPLPRYLTMHPHFHSRRSAGHRHGRLPTRDLIHSVLETRSLEHYVPTLPPSVLDPAFCCSSGCAPAPSRIVASASIR